jgi:hypothetical protein
VQTAAAKVTTALRFSAVIGNFPRAGATSDNGVHGLSKLGSENSSSSGSGALARDIPREGSEQQRDVFVLGGKWYCLEVSAAVLSVFL